MRITDLGEIDAPLVFFGGPYSNLQALEALIARSEEIGALTEHMISTGDAVAYCADGAACVELMQRFGIHLVSGNCEKQLATGASDCGCGFDEGSSCDILSGGWYQYALRTIDARARVWLGSAPDVIVLSHCNMQVAVIHGGITDVARFLWSTSPSEAFQEEIDRLRTIGIAPDIVISGHCGMAFERHIEGVHWINAGTIGMPENDGQRTTRFLVVEDGRPSFASLAYPAQRAAAAMVKAGLTQGYETALLTGFWPSEDVLPKELRRAATG